MALNGIPEGRFLTISDGLSVHLHEEGSGPAVVFVHGSGPGASGYSNFKANYPVFAAAGYRAVVPDMIGYGLTGKPVDRTYHLDLFVDSLRETLDALEIECCTLVGNSLGGAIAIKLALDAPQRVDCLILMAPGGLEELEVYMQMPGIQRMMGGFLKGGGLTREGLQELLKLLVFDPRHVTPALVQERYDILQAQPREVLATMQVPNLEARLGEIACPVLGFWGIDDQFCPASGADKILRACRGSRMTMQSDCGHWVMAEYPQLFNRQCLDFLREHGIGAEVRQ